jgi:hypothetical protein
MLDALANRRDDVAVQVVDQIDEREDNERDPRRTAPVEKGHRVFSGPGVKVRPGKYRV